MIDPRKDFGPGVLAGIISVVLFILLMMFVALLGQRAGDAMRNRAAAGGGTSLTERAAASIAAARAAHAREPETVEERSLAPPPRQEDAGVPVFCYHYLRGPVGPVRLAKVLGSVLLSLPLLDDTEIWTQSARQFDLEMSYLYHKGFRTVTLAELDAYQRGVGMLPEKPVVITFDDADRSVYEYAYPTLAKYGFTATLFVVTSRVGTTWENIESLTWDELRELHESGVFQIESHSHAMHHKVETDAGFKPVFIAAETGAYDLAAPGAPGGWKAAVRADLVESRRLIEAHTGHIARYLAWPYGMNSEACDSLAFSAGFRRVLVLREGLNYRFTPRDALAATAALRCAESGPVPAVTPQFLARLEPGFGPPQETGEAPLTERFWLRIEIKRYAVTARTSLRFFRQMLYGEYHGLDG